VVELGTHEELLRLGGHYDKLWRHQSGGFLAHGALPGEAAAEPAGELAGESGEAGEVVGEPTERARA
ncbi:MAG: hypothetical protein H7Y16_00555, partial [Candidatus Parcubacteria bacterium]|nr:hypothetical protein [Burkholderiales bacterium]